MCAETLGRDGYAPVAGRVVGCRALRAYYGGEAVRGRGDEKKGYECSRRPSVNFFAFGAAPEEIESIRLPAPPV